MREPEWLQDGAVERDDVARSRDQREAELVLEGEEIIRCGHVSTIHMA